MRKYKIPLIILSLLCLILYLLHAFNINVSKAGKFNISRSVQESQTRKVFCKKYSYSEELYFKYGLTECYSEDSYKIPGFFFNESESSGRMKTVIFKYDGSKKMPMFLLQDWPKRYNRTGTFDKSIKYLLLPSTECIDSLRINIEDKIYLFQ